MPVFKSADSSKPENFRPIFVLPVLLKVFEKAVYNKLMDFLEEENVLSDSQCGFRKKKQSIKSACTLLCDSVRREIDNGKMVDCIYIDLSKAFDTIGHGV